MILATRTSLARPDVGRASILTVSELTALLLLRQFCGDSVVECDCIKASR